VSFVVLSVSTVVVLFDFFSRSKLGELGVLLRGRSLIRKIRRSDHSTGIECE